MEAAPAGKGKDRFADTGTMLADQGQAGIKITAVEHDQGTAVTGAAS